MAWSSVERAGGAPLWSRCRRVGLVGRVGGLAWRSGVRNFRAHLAVRDGMRHSWGLVGVRRLGAVLAVAATTGALGYPSIAAAGDAPQYRVAATVIEANGRDPRLCWGVQLSLPPKCGDGLELDGWSWAKAPRVERLGGTTWGTYRLVGTYDGKRFQVLSVNPPRAAASRSDTVDFGTRCDTPPGGWVNRDAAKLRIEDAALLAEAARSSPDFVVMWPDRAKPIQVTNVAFTGPVEDHRPALEDLWGGPLCVLQYRYSQAELLVIQEALTTDLSQRLGVQTISSYVDEPGNRVVMGVVVERSEAKARLDRRYGRGVVVLEPWLERIR